MTSIADQIDAILLAVDGLTTDMATKSTSTAAATHLKTVTLENESRNQQ